MWPNPQFSIDLVTFTGEILKWKLHYFAGNESVFSTGSTLISTSFSIFNNSEKFSFLSVVYTVQKKNFALRISSVNMTKSAVSCGFGHIYWRNP